MTTQQEHPWRTTARTVFQGLIALSASWAIVVEAMNLDPGLAWVSASLAVAAAITRVMAIPQVEQFFERFFPWLAADPEPGSSIWTSKEPPG